MFKFIKDNSIWVLLLISLALPVVMVPSIVFVAVLFIGLWGVKYWLKNRKN